ncbi:hypothetical protein PUV54_00380 [Hyphococcus flavus]|uniref:Uncharacterized protein n=1 Tax=Hyphococcus flavus TaxID=1866326 RepID=A0AAF0CH95_9PROT|nr:hypothetical protein [Hyphococcus flavus]WDI31647.1 hypothetical protein PUV54_00380 [Hyphococcus flavus]
MAKRKIKNYSVGYSSKEDPPVFIILNVSGPKEEIRMRASSASGAMILGLLETGRAFFDDAPNSRTIFVAGKPAAKEKSDESETDVFDRLNEEG